MTVAYDEGTQTFGVSAAKGLAAGEGCSTRPARSKQVSCHDRSGRRAG